MTPPVVQVRRLPHHEGLPMPARQTAGSAGYDVYSADPDFQIAPMERRLVRTGLALAIPAGFEAQVRPRSGLAIKQGLTLPNTPATIDSDYRGELMIGLINLGTEPVAVTRGMRIAQLVFQRVEQVELVEVEELPESGARSGWVREHGSVRSREIDDDRSRGRARADRRCDQVHGRVRISRGTVRLPRRARRDGGTWYCPGSWRPAPPAARRGRCMHSCP